MALIPSDKGKLGKSAQAKKLGFALDPSDNMTRSSALLTSEDWAGIMPRVAARIEADKARVEAFKQTSSRSLGARAAALAGVHKEAARPQLMDTRAASKEAKADYLSMPDKARIATVGDFFEVVKHYAAQVPNDRAAQLIKKTAERRWVRAPQAILTVGELKGWVKSARTLSASPAVDAMVTEGLAQVAELPDYHNVFKRQAHLVKSQADFDRVTVEYGLTSNSFEHRFARSYFAKLVDEIANEPPARTRQREHVQRHRARKAGKQADSFDQELKEIDGKQAQEEQLSPEELQQHLEEFAREDVAMAKAEGSMAIADTKKGVLWVNYADGQFTIGGNAGETPFYQGDEAGAVKFVAENYIVEHQAKQAQVDGWVVDEAGVTARDYADGCEGVVVKEADSYGWVLLDAQAEHLADGAALSEQEAQAACDKAFESHSPEHESRQAQSNGFGNIMEEDGKYVIDDPHYPLKSEPLIIIDQDMATALALAGKTENVAYKAVAFGKAELLDTGVMALQASPDSVHQAHRDFFAVYAARRGSEHVAVVHERGTPRVWASSSRDEAALKVAALGIVDRLAQRSMAKCAKFEATPGGYFTAQNERGSIVVSKEAGQNDYQAAVYAPGADVTSTAIARFTGSLGEVTRQASLALQGGSGIMATAYLDQPLDDGDMQNVEKGMQGDGFAVELSEVSPDAINIYNYTYACEGSLKYWLNVAGVQIKELATPTRGASQVDDIATSQDGKFTPAERKAQNYDDLGLLLSDVEVLNGDYEVTSDWESNPAGSVLSFDHWLGEVLQGYINLDSAHLAGESSATGSGSWPAHSVCDAIVSGKLKRIDGQDVKNICEKVLLGD